MDGYETLKAIREFEKQKSMDGCSAIRVIIITSLTEHDFGSLCAQKKRDGHNIFFRESVSLLRSALVHITAVCAMTKTAYICTRNTQQYTKMPAFCQDKNGYVCEFLQSLYKGLMRLLNCV